MDYSLNIHPKYYSLSARDVGISFVTGFSGVPYALRHLECARRFRSQALGHRLIAGLEMLPVIGGLVALIERVAILVKNLFQKCVDKPSRFIDTNELLTNENINSLKAIKHLNRSASVALTAVSIMAYRLGIHLERTSNNFFNLPVTIEFQGKRIDSSEIISKFQDTANIESLAKLLKNLLEKGIAAERAYLNQLENNPLAQRPIWEINEDGKDKIKEFRLIDKNECEEIIQLWERISAGIKLPPNQDVPLDAVYQSIVYDTIQNVENKQVENQELAAV